MLIAKCPFEFTKIVADANGGRPRSISCQVDKGEKFEGNTQAHEQLLVAQGVAEVANPLPENYYDWESCTVEELKRALNDAKVEVPDKTKKADLVKLCEDNL